MVNQIFKHGILFVFGGLLYVLAEFLFRGYSHWTMILAGGLCFVLIGLLNELFPEDMPLWKQGIIGAVMITAVELIVGYFVNIRLGWQVWDYSDMPLNIAGQICPAFTILWFFVSIAAVILDDFLRALLFDEEWPEYH